ncbi:hypothetical protein HDA40_001479 [Hamadaea flava]|uniref:Uncharacterized protein n=1 Tax=Hamadaea flava TaxID=1742688 RepID=A0ABV8LNC0_9ACTN|nr:hypothetical protein [Hamadaea flava]MCP2322972.1 hypothetical protein [Hamadaea flava]
MGRRQRGQRPTPAARTPYRGPGWKQHPTLGVDVGGVIVALAGREEDTSFFGTRPLETPATVGVFDALAKLTESPFGGRVHVVSKAGPKVEANTRAWLAHQDFFGRTGVDPGNVHFVRERRDKAPVCERLGITHFVDDRLDVLAYLATVDHRYLFTAGTAEGADGELPDWVTAVDSWPALTALLGGDAGSR